jgi:hypothetical protein
MQGSVEGTGWRRQDSCRGDVARGFRKHSWHIKTREAASLRWRIMATIPARSISGGRAARCVLCDIGLDWVTSVIVAQQPSRKSATFQSISHFLKYRFSRSFVYFSRPRRDPDNVRQRICCMGLARKISQPWQGAAPATELESRSPYLWRC